MPKIKRKKKWGPVVKRIREKAGLSRVELAREIGINRAAVYYYEAGASGVNDQTLEAILEACDCTFLEFAVAVNELTDYGRRKR